MTKPQAPNSKYERDIYERVYEFAIEVVKFTRLLPKNLEADVLRKQVIRSSTSVAANMQEADGSRTRQEFIHSVAVSKKEAKETKLWIRMIVDLYPKLIQKAEPILKENEEIIRILSTIMINASVNK
jgi:four helix bundle protein